MEYPAVETVGRGNDGPEELLMDIMFLPVNSDDEEAALGELPMVIHDKQVPARVEELPVNSEDEVAALGELPMVIHDKEEARLW